METTYPAVLELFKVPQGMISVEVTLPYGQLSTTLLWCKNNLVGDYKTKQGTFRDGSFNHTFYFSNEIDRMIFSLRWL